MSMLTDLVSLYDSIFYLVPFYGSSDNLLPKPSWVKMSQLRTLSTQRLGKMIAKVDEKDLNAILSGLNRLCG
ncbi:MAG: type II toxin-antitoxin system PemK/MazF family toxin [Xenococcus sp. (in: cyanobacteria)]